jgi:hypothetical protein
MVHLLLLHNDLAGKVYLMMILILMMIMRYVAYLSLWLVLLQALVQAMRFLALLSP